MCLTLQLPCRKRNVMSELSNVKLVAKNGILEIGATDLDLYLNQTIGAEIKKRENQLFQLKFYLN